MKLIVACCSRSGQEAARNRLLELFERDMALAWLRDAPWGWERMAKFCANLVVAAHVLDLTSIQSTHAFADEVARS
jgi:hypothetical protein